MRDRYDYILEKKNIPAFFIMFFPNYIVAALRAIFYCYFHHFPYQIV